jgi:GNAT superfamily N-acetyltransferase
VRILRYDSSNHRSLVEVIDEVCAECDAMETSRYIPTPAWEHALHQPGCSHHLLQLANVDGRIVGWCRLFPPDCAEGFHHYELGIGLLADYRGRGIGTGLLQAALDWVDCRRRNVEVNLWVKAGNWPARRVFEKQGFMIHQNYGDRLQMVIKFPANCGTIVGAKEESLL